MPRGLAIGIGLAAWYVVVMVATMVVSERQMRPLFDGLTEPPPYQWVKPPPGYGLNVKPQETKVSVPVAPEGSVAAGPTSSDGQVVLNLPEGAIPRHHRDTEVDVTITPLDANRLGALPAGLRFEGNAYEIEMVSRPSGRKVTRLAQPGNIVLATPEPASVLLFAREGRRWETLSTQRVGGPDSVGSPFERTGYYVAAIPGNPAPEAGSGNWLDTGRKVLIGVLVVALAVNVALRVRADRRSRAMASTFGDDSSM